MYIETSATKKILAMKGRIKIVQGGTSASKTISILLYLIDKAQSVPGLTISIVSESLPHLKKGAMKDFFSILKEHGYYSEARHNKTDHIFTFSNGSYVEFFGVEDADKVRGPRRDILFINECNNVPYMVFDQMEVRTRLEVILDFNPTNEFWVNTEVIPHMAHDFIRLTYRDNEALDPAIIESIESRKHNANWWKVYGEGEMGNREGQVYQHFQQIGHIPEEALLSRYGLDFGYTIDPSGLLQVYRWNNAFIFNELLYEVGQSNLKLANAIRSSEGLAPVLKENTRYEGQTKVLAVADSQEPKSIDEMTGYGVKIVGAVKGPDSIDYGVQLLQNQEIFVTNWSANIMKESRNYLWKTDPRTGKSLNVPIDDFNHILDAARYAIVDLVGIMDKRHNVNRISV